MSKQLIYQRFFNTQRKHKTQWKSHLNLYSLKENKNKLKKRYFNFEFQFSKEQDDCFQSTA